MPVSKPLFAPLTWVKIAPRNVVETSRFLRSFCAAIFVCFTVACVPESRTVETSLITVVDGDTIRISEVSHRLIGLDTPETFRASCAYERAMGNRATSRLRELIFAQGTVDLISELSPDRYGRVLSELRISGVEVADILIAEGLARPYSGGTRYSWC